MREGTHQSQIGARCGSMHSGYITAIAEPRIIIAWSPLKAGKKSYCRNSGNIFSEDHRALHVDDSSPAPDFRITKNTGVQNDSIAKLAKINSKRNSIERIPRA